MFEVDLGTLKSLNANEIHIDELRATGGQLKEGQQIVDDYSNTDGTTDYKLVMVGRKIDESETEL